ncbi:MAG: hypothetical protein JJE17_08805 [Peptostreptococcaceae bacterium]|nr:hypothetical protein [Peptostreptococcaceae bacterium]
MQITSASITGGKVIFESILDEVPGGLSLPVATLDNLKVDATLSVDKRWLKAGAPVYVDIAARTATLCKSALGIIGGDSTHPRVSKDNHFAVGEFLNDGANTGLISAIDVTNAGYDIITVNTALLFAAATKFGQGSVTGGNTTLAFTPNGLTKDDVYIADGNADVAVVTMGTVRADALTYPINALYAIALRGGAAGTGTSLITLV